MIRGMGPHVCEVWWLKVFRFWRFARAKAGPESWRIILKGHSGFENGVFRVLSAFGSLPVTQCTPIDFSPRLFRVHYGFTAHFMVINAPERGWQAVLNIIYWTYHSDPRVYWPQRKTQALKICLQNIVPSGAEHQMLWLWQCKHNSPEWFSVILPSL